jgi:sec-independent protein translocase protein TatA
MPIDVGPWEIVILLAVLALLFGSKEVPDVARRLGKARREMRGVLGEVDPRRMLDGGDDHPAATPPAPDRREPRA